MFLPRPRTVQVVAIRIKPTDDFPIANRCPRAKYPDPPALTPNQLKGTIGCIRTRNQDINELADFFEGNCKNETNYLTKQ